MEYSPLVKRIAGEGAEAWTIHTEAVDAQARGENIIVLSIGDPDLDTPEPIADAAVAALRDGDTHYIEVTGESRLREAIASDFEASGGGSTRPDNVCVVSGTQNGLFFASMLLLGADDEVIVLEPNYVSYEATIGASGAQPVLVPTHTDSGFRPDTDAIRQAVTANTRAILLSNPNNPTGVNMTPDELAAVAAIAREHDLWVISDEVYAALTFDAPHYRMAGLPGMAERTVTVSSLSKSHAMTGWRSGWLIGPQELVRHAENLALCVLYGLPGFIQQAAVTALEQGEAITGQMRGVYRRRRDLVMDHLSTLPGLRVVPAEAGMFLMLDIRATGLSGRDFAWQLLRETGVSVLDATAFGPSAAGHVRLTYASDEASLEEGCRRIGQFVRDRISWQTGVTHN